MVLTALPLFIAACVKQGCVGGADIKLMAASGLMLGAGRGIIALCVELFLGVVCTYIYRKVKQRVHTMTSQVPSAGALNTSFPLVPFLAAGCITALLL